MSGLQFGPPGAEALHVAVDMQRVFAEPGAWYAPTLNDITPVIERIVARQASRTVFTRFVTPRSAEQAIGAWQRYYHHWQSVTLQQMDRRKLDLVAPLACFPPAATVVDKSTHSAFDSADFTDLLHRRGTETLIFTGVETDVCVLASVLAAVDRGFRVIVVEDAVTSSSAAGHTATLESILPRFDQQIELVPSHQLLAAWDTD